MLMSRGTVVPNHTPIKKILSLGENNKVGCGLEELSWRNEGIQTGLPPPKS